MRPVTEADHRDRIQRVITQVRTEPERTLSVGDMADIAALSPFHVIRVFREITGYTPAAIQTALRVQEAKRLLAAEGSSVTDACYAVGFSSLGSFSQRFTTLAGVKPSEYRNAVEFADSLADDLSRLQREPLMRMHERHTVSGRIIGDASRPAYYFVGLFPPGPPRGRPLLGDVLEEPGNFVIRHVPDGVYAIYCAAVAHPEKSIDWVMPDTEWQTGGGQSVQMICGMPVHSLEIELRPRIPVMVPLMTTVMAIPNLADDARMNHTLTI
jgi:AraC family transcriptional regulator